MDVLAFPFGFDSSGRARVVQHDSDECLLQRAAAFVRTRRGELLLAPDYGIDDPALRILHEQEILSGLALYHPEMEINAIAIYQQDDVALIVDLDISAAVESDAETALLDRRVIFDA